jgi:hypothetical protein
MADTLSMESWLTRPSQKVGPYIRRSKSILGAWQEAITKHKGAPARAVDQRCGKVIKQWNVRARFEDPLAQRLANFRSLPERFRDQADRWQRETQHLSSPLQRMMHPSYQAILGMAAEQKRPIIRLMLLDMQQNRRDWLLALSYLTQANPMNPKDAGKTDKLVEAWVNWGREQGIIEK